MKNIKLTEGQLERVINRLKEQVTASMDGGSGFVDDQGSSQSLDKFNKRQQDMGEQVTELGSSGKKEFQKMKGLPTVGTPPIAPENETKISPEMTHDQFMDQLDEMCPEITKQEKMVSTTNRSCGRCHKEEMALLRKYCLTR